VTGTRRRLRARYSSRKGSRGQGDRRGFTGSSLILVQVLQHFESSVFTVVLFGGVFRSVPTTRWFRGRRGRLLGVFWGPATPVRRWGRERAADPTYCLHSESYLERQQRQQCTKTTKTTKTVTTGPRVRLYTIERKKTTTRKTNVLIN